MRRDERFYAFIVARTSRSCSRIRHISIHERWIQVCACALAVLFGAASYGVYGLTQQAARLRIERENDRLREENDRQRQQLDQLKSRVDAIEDSAKRLSEISGITQDEGGASAEEPYGTGGPYVSADEATVSAIEDRAARLEGDLKVFEAALRERSRIPSAWPVEGEVSDGFGGRHNPFGDGSFEFHSGQDISAPRGTAVLAAGGGTVSFAGTQNGYGNLVILDHGSGLTTRYGHLSRITVGAGQELKRGDALGEVGSTGRSTGPHLHYEVRINDVAVNPRNYLPAQ